MENDLTLEKIKIAERLAILEHCTNDLSMKIDELHKAIMGNGTVGLLTKVDRLEQTEKIHKESRMRMWTFSIGTAIAFITKTIWDHFK